MRDVLTVAGVIVVALGLGGFAAYMSVDLTPPGLDLIRPLKPAVVAQKQKIERERAIQAKASGCKYCMDIAALAESFSRRAETARNHAAALRVALLRVSDEAERTASRQEELRQAHFAATQADNAASVLIRWANRCSSESFCKIRLSVTQASCSTTPDLRTDASVVIASSVRKLAASCASAACPSVDCQSAASLNADLRNIENTLDSIGGRTRQGGQSAMAALPVGPSTLKAEIKRINDEVGYVARMLPPMLDTKKTNNRLPTMASAMIDERAVSASTLATVVEQAAALSDDKESDPRYEASWRLKALALNLAALGKGSQPSNAMDWKEAANSLGAAFMDLAQLQAMLDRAAGTASADAGCDATAASAAQQLRDAMAALDLCRMRAACVGQGGAEDRVKAPSQPDNVFERAQTTVGALTVQDLGESEFTPVGNTMQRPAIDVLRKRGVCRRAGDLIEAKAAAPDSAVAVAEAVVPQALAPTGVPSPQDLVSGGLATALDMPAEPVLDEPVVETVARYSAAMPRFKPRRMRPIDPDVLGVSAPSTSGTSVLTPATDGVVLPETGAPVSTTFGTGGPTKTTPPAEPTGE